MRQFPLGKLSATTAAALLTCALAGVGCESHDRHHDAQGGRGRVTDRDQQQQTQADGTQVRTRSQVRQTPGGQAVRETETQTREPVQPGAEAEATTPRQ